MYVQLDMCIFTYNIILWFLSSTTRQCAMLIPNIIYFWKFTKWWSVFLIPFVTPNSEADYKLITKWGSTRANSRGHFRKKGIKICNLQETGNREFPGGPVVRTRCFQCNGPGSIPGRGTKIPQAMQRGPKEKKKKKKERQEVEVIFSLTYSGGGGDTHTNSFMHAFIHFFIHAAYKYWAPIPFQMLQVQRWGRWPWGLGSSGAITTAH